MKYGEIIPEGVLFGNQKMGDLPDYLQRVMVSKKTLYSKHLTSIPSSNNLPLPSPSKEEIAKAQLKSGSQKVEVPMIG